MEKTVNTRVRDTLLLKLLSTFKNILETDVVKKYLSEWQSSDQEPDACKRNDEKRRKSSTQSDSEENFDHSSSACISDSQDSFDIGLCEGLGDSDDSDFVPSQEFVITPTTSTSVASTYVPQNGEQMPESILNSITSVNAELDHKKSTECSPPLPTDSEKWLIQPKNPLLWRLLWRYGLKFMDGLEHVNLHSYKVKNYIDQICDWINLDTSKESAESDLYLVNDYQIVTPDGKIWLKSRIRAIARCYVQDLQTIDKSRKSLCVFKRCRKCPYKSIPTPVETVLSHILRIMGALYHCVPCGAVLMTKSTVYKHARYCPYGFRVAEHHDTCWQIPRIKRVKKMVLGKVVINDYQNKALEFNRWVTNLLTNIQRDGFLINQTKEKLMDSIKEDIDHNFVYLFEQINKKISPKTKFAVYPEDNYYTILYPKRNQKDPTKSAMFRIIEVATRQTTSVHRLKKVRDETWSFKDMKCHYEYCRCNQSYQNANEASLIGHILSENFLIACAGCQIGFVDLSEFEKHLNDNCYIERNVVVPK